MGQRLALAACLVLGGAAGAQTLNLDRSDAPEPGSGKAALALADTLEKEAQALLKPRGAGEAPAASRARAALRSLAAEWIREGESQSPGSSAKVLIGRTIALRRDALDIAVGPDDAGAARAFAAAALAHDLEHHPELSGVAQIDRFLRDALWPLYEGADTPGGAGWPRAIATPAVDRSLAELGAEAELDASSLLAVGAFEKRVQSAGLVPAYRASSEELRRAGADVLDAISRAHAKLLAPNVRDLLRRELVEAAGAVGGEDGPARLTGAERLRRLGLLSRALLKAASLDTTNNAVRILRTAVEEYALARAWRDGPGVTARLRLLIRTIDQALPDPLVVEDQTLPRQLRPAMRLLEPLARKSGQQTLEIAPRILQGADATADPAVLGAITAHARRLNDLRLLRGAATIVSDPSRHGDPDVLPSRRFVTERFLLFGQDLAKPEKRDLAISELRDLASQLRDTAEVPGEKELRASADDEGWRQATDGHTRELAAALDSARAAWNNSWTGPKSLPPIDATRRLAAFRDHLALLADCAAALNMGADASRLNAWPGWELSGEAAEWLVTGLAERARALSAGLTSGSAEAVDAARKALASDIVATTIGRLDRRAGALGVAALPDPPTDALAQFIYGTPPADAWLGEAREEVAAMSRFVEEAGAASTDVKRKAEVARFRAVAERAARSVSMRLDVEAVETMPSPKAAEKR